MLMNEAKGHQRNAQGKPYEGKPHVRFDEGTVETSWSYHRHWFVMMHVAN